MIVTMDRVRKIIAEALYLESEEVTPDASLMKDLGAESIDFLDIIFRLEKEFSIKIPKGDIERKARGSLTDAEFAVNGIIQPKGLSALKAAMPEVDAGEFHEKLSLRDIPGLFTVSTFDRMVREQIGGASEEAKVLPIGKLPGQARGDALSSRA